MVATANELERGEKEDRLVVSALAKVGVQTSSIYDLVNSRQSYPKAIPVLIGLLPQVQDERVKEGIVRALTVKAAHGVAARPLVVEFRKEYETPGVKWAIGNALAIVADESVFEDLVDLLRDRNQGKAREMLAIALANTKSPRTIDILIGLLDDEEVAGHAVVALGKLQSSRARPYIERFLNHPKPWVQAEARRALRRLRDPPKH